MEQALIISSISARTDVGLVRSNNEDSLLLADLNEKAVLPSHSNLTRPLQDNYLLMVVSDGMGGAEAGEVASELTVLAIKDVFARLSRNIPPHDRLVAAVEEANHIVWNESQTNGTLKGMGATATAVVVDGNQAYIAEVGDSRAYLIRSGKIKQVTTDQSFVAQLVAKGLLRPEDAIIHPRKNMILQSIGVRDTIKVAVTMFQLRRDDALLICSDGLSNLVIPSEMLYFAENYPPSEATQHLIDLAKSRGGNDNITVILSRFDGSGLADESAKVKMTDDLKTISSYDPEENIEKSHMRTQLLGAASFGDRYYGSSSGSQKKIRITEAISEIPQKDMIQDSLRKLVEHIDYTYQLFDFTKCQTEASFDELLHQSVHFLHQPAILENIKEAMNKLEEAKDSTAKLFKFFTNGDVGVSEERD
ncbi:MAG: serine/threonine-protein phosphatase [Blastocatellia bacterium]|nr:serine/threonine-protein phosphatase [Blastocatellia bacterium]